MDEYSTAVLNVRRRDNLPHAWSATVTDLGNALVRLSEMTGDTSYLYQALDQFDKALEVVTLARLPRDYSGTQNNLGYTRMRLFEMVGHKHHLETSVLAFRNAEKGAPRSQAPLDWAVIQVGLAQSLFLHGAPPSLDQAMTATQNALDVLTQDLAPVTWANA